MQQQSVIPKSPRARMFLFFLLLPGVLSFASLFILFSLPDSQVSHISDLLTINWFEWRSIRRLAEKESQQTFNRVRLCVGVGLLISVASIPFMCGVFHVYGDNGLRRVRELMQPRILLTCLGAVGMALAIIFLFPNAYVASASRRLVAFSPDYLGMSVLAVILYGISFFSSPVVFWLISVACHRINGGYSE